MPTLIESSDEESFAINAAFAEKYAAQKQAEELSQLKDKFSGVSEERLRAIAGEEDETSTEEDEDGELLTPAVESQILRTISAVRRRDPAIYDPGTAFFGDSVQDKPGNSEKREVTFHASYPQKPFTLADYHRERLLEAGGEYDEEPETGLTHVQEQSKLKAEFIDAANESDSQDDNLFVVKKNQLVESESEDEKPVIKPRDSAEEFLLSYIQNQGWRDNPAEAPALLSDASSEEERADEFEIKYNFRFEEPGSAKIVTHARDVPASLRRKDERRKLQREAKKRRREEEKQREAEQVKRLKNLAKEDAKKRLEKISAVAGRHVEMDLDGDYDPQKFDAEMERLFNNEYYDDEDVDEKPEFSDMSDAEYDSSPPSRNVERDVSETPNLDYESKIGDLKTRFKYRQVPAETFDLEPEEILAADDKTLNEFISLKKLAPYREFKVDRKTLKKKLKVFRSKVKV